MVVIRYFEDGLCLLKKVNEQVIEQQFRIKQFPLPQNIDVVHTAAIGTELRKKINYSEQQSTILMYIRQNKQFHKSANLLDTRLIYLNQLATLINHFQSMDIQTRILYSNGACLFLLVKEFTPIAHGSCDLKQLARSITPSSQKSEIDCLANVPDLKRLTKVVGGSLHFVGDIHNIKETIPMDLGLLTQLVDMVSMDGNIGNELHPFLGVDGLTIFKHRGYTYRIGRGRQLAIIMDNLQLERFRQSLQFQLSNTNQRMLVISNKCPPGFETIDLDKFRIDLIYMFREYETSEYSDILRIIEYLYNIQDFAQILLQFWNAYELSKDEEIRNRIEFEELHNLLKYAKSEELEVTIQAQERLKLLDFLEQFSYSQILGSAEEYEPPRYLHIPVSDVKSSILLLLCVLKYTDFAGIYYDYLLVEDIKVSRALKQGILPQMSRDIFAEHALILRTDYPGRKSVLDLPKLIVHPNNQCIRYLEKYVAKVSGNCFFMPSQHSVVQVSLYQTPQLHEISNESHEPGIEEELVVTPANQPRIDPPPKAELDPQQDLLIDPPKVVIDAQQDELVDQVDEDEPEEGFEKIISTFNHLIELDYWLNLQGTAPPVPDDDLLAFISDFVHIFSVLTFLHYSSSQRVNRDLLPVDDAAIELCNAHEYVSKDQGDRIYLRILPKGREKLHSAISYLRSLPDFPREIITQFSAIIEYQLQYGATSYLFSLLYWAQIIGKQYYDKFKKYPPISLAVAFVVNELLHEYRVNNPREVANIFHATYIDMISQLNNEIKSTVHIGGETLQTPVPRPFTEEKKQEVEFEMAPVDISDVPKPASLKIIVDESTADLAEFMEPVQERDLVKTVPPELVKWRKARLEDISKKKTQRNISTDGGAIKIEPLIYSPRKNVDTRIILEYPVTHLSLPRRILKVLENDLQLQTIADFKNYQFSTGIKGIGPKSLEQISQLQLVLEHIDSLEPIDLFLLMSSKALPDMLNDGLELPLQYLPAYVFKKPDPELQSSTIENVQDASSPLAILTLIHEFVERVLDHPIQGLPEEQIVTLHKLQQKIGKLVYNEEKDSFDLLDTSYLLGLESKYRNGDAQALVRAKELGVHDLSNLYIPISGDDL